MANPGSRSVSRSFQRGYYEQQYRARAWRKRGDRPLLYRSLLRHLRPWFGGKLLDVGCGEGHFLRRASRHFEPHGVDISVEGVALARRTSGLDTIVVGSALELPFEDGFFSVVACLDVLEHLERPEEALLEFARVLHPAGALIISTPNPASFGHRVKGSRSFIYRDETHVSVRPIAGWRHSLRMAGFAVVRDGTDTLWDTPYTQRVPARAQWLVFISLAQLMWAIRPMYPWAYGENYVCLAERSSG
jgi:2-polyprenyl-3-methyl-5-hydroxy-6-metoxy-1,4-benzoquinol methylase